MLFLYACPDNSLITSYIIQFHYIVHKFKIFINLAMFYKFPKAKNNYILFLKCCKF